MSTLAADISPEDALAAMQARIAANRTGETVARRQAGTATTPTLPEPTTPTAPEPEAVPVSPAPEELPAELVALDKFAAMIARAESEGHRLPDGTISKGLRKIPRFVLPDDCLGHVIGVDDASCAVRGAANVIRHCPNPDMRKRAIRTLEEIDAIYRLVPKGAPMVTVEPAPSEPKAYAGNAAKAREASAGMPGVPPARAKEKPRDQRQEELF